MSQKFPVSRIVFFLFVLAACGPGQGGAPPSVGGGSADEGAYLFDDSVVRTYSIELSEENREFLDASPAREAYVSGSIVIDGERIGPVGVRYKGSVGSFTGCVAGGGGGGITDVSGPKVCPKLGIKISFNQFVQDGRWKGLKKLQFHAMNQDPTYMKEALGYSMFQDFGVASSRVAFARLEMNDEFIGVFVLVEELDSRFAESRFGELEGGEGNLYKDFWPSRDGPEADFINTIRSEFGASVDTAIRTNRSDPTLNHETMVGFITEFQEALTIGPDETDQVVDRWMDVEYVLKYFAIDRALEADDGPMHFIAIGQAGDPYTGNGWNHNYYWYAAHSESEASPDTKKLWPVAWDLDNTLGSGLVDSWVEVPWNDLDLECVLVPHATSFPPVPTIAPACDPLIRSLARRQEAYRKIEKEMLDGPFSEKVVNGKLNRWEQLLTPHVADEVRLGIRRSGDVSGWQGLVQQLRDYLALRRSEIASTIDF
jgi:spore coat protein CotH